METINKAVILHASKGAKKQGYKYNLQIWTNVNGNGFVYCGNGKFCKNIEECLIVANKYKAVFEGKQNLLLNNWVKFINACYLSDKNEELYKDDLFNIVDFTDEYLTMFNRYCNVLKKYKDISSKYLAGELKLGEISEKLELEIIDLEKQLYNYSFDYIMEEQQNEYRDIQR